MSESIHGHQVMKMMAKSGKTYSRATLKEDIVAEFGEAPIFHVCHDDNLTADDLINFLASQGKFVESEAGLSMPEKHLCQ